MTDNIIARDIRAVGGAVWLFTLLMAASIAILLAGAVAYVEFAPQTMGWFAVYLLISCYLIRVAARMLGVIGRD